MKRIYTTLALTTALALGMSAVASADEHRGHRHRDGDRQTHAEKRPDGSKFRANRRAIRRDIHRDEHRHGHYRDGRKYRDKHRHNSRRAHRRAHKHARRHWREHRRAEHRARRHWRAQQRHERRVARRHWHGDRICYSDHRDARYYYNDGVSLWVDGLRFFFADAR